ncbi:YitT family protein, partial [Bacillus thuringiensis]
RASFELEFGCLAFRGTKPEFTVFSHLSLKRFLFRAPLHIQTIDTVIQGLDETKAVLIVSDQYEEVSNAILHRLGRGTTKLVAKGGYTDKEKEVIYAVVTRLEVTKLKSIVYEIDANAFVTIMSTQETNGGKFKSAIH